MQDPQVLDTIRSKYVALLDDLDERGRRRWAAVEARALGRGGITAVASATGLSDRTVRTGLKELDDTGPLAGHRRRGGSDPAVVGGAGAGAPTREAARSAMRS